MPKKRKRRKHASLTQTVGREAAEGALPERATSPAGRGPLPVARVVAPLGVSLALLACYWFTLAPTIAERDCGELCTAVHTMGVPHPTGYPLYLMVGKLFDLLPLGEPARRIAFFSAASAAAAGGVICWVLIALTSSVAGGVLAGLTAGANSWVWSQANQQEVYALHALLVALVLAMFVRWSGERSPRRLNQLAVVCGLALSHHRTSMFFIGPLLLWAVATTRPISARLLARTAGFAALPLLLYLWLPLRSGSRPPIDWGNTSGSLQFFYNHISGNMYYKFAFADSLTNAVVRTKAQALGLWQQLGPVGLALAVGGAVVMVRRRQWRALGVSLLLSFTAVVVWAAFYGVVDKEPFYMPALLVISAWCGAGLAYAARAVRKLKSRPAARRLAPAAAMLVALVVPANTIRVNWKGVDRSQDYHRLEVAACSLRGIPSNAVILLFGDEPNSASLYYCYVLHPRSAPLILSANRTCAKWATPLLDPKMRRVVAEAIKLPQVPRLPVLANGIREAIEPSQPLYVNFALQQAPPGYMLLLDYGLTRVVRPPGIPQARDVADMRPVLEFPGGAGALLYANVPAQATRGQALTIAAGVRWTGRAPLPDGKLRFLFAHSSVARKVARGGEQTATPSLNDWDWAPRASVVPDERRAVDSVVTKDRFVPILFDANVPPSRPGFHYRQTFNVLLGRRMTPGTYQVFVQAIHSTLVRLSGLTPESRARATSRTRLVPIGTMRLR